MNGNLKLKTTFGRVSKLYDISRVTYSPELINDIIAYSHIKKGATLLDVGCGSGQATIPFAEKCFNVLGFDISKNLLSIAQKNALFFLIPNLLYVHSKRCLLKRKNMT